MEVDAALRRTDLTVIPVLVQGAHMPLRSELPTSSQALARRPRTLQPVGPPVRVGERLGATIYDNHRLYVVDRAASTLVALDGATGKPLNDPLALHGPLGGLTVDAGVVWVGSTDGVTPVDEATFVVGQPFPLAQAGLFDIHGGVLWVSFPIEDVVRRFTLATRATIGDPVPGVGRDLGASEIGDEGFWATRARTDDVVLVQVPT